MVIRSGGRACPPSKLRRGLRLYDGLEALEVPPTRGQRPDSFGAAPLW